MEGKTRRRRIMPQRRAQVGTNHRRGNHSTDLEKCPKAILQEDPSLSSRPSERASQHSEGLRVFHEVSSCGTSSGVSASGFTPIGSSGSVPDSILCRPAGWGSSRKVTRQKGCEAARNLWTDGLVFKTSHVADRPTDANVVLVLSGGNVPMGNLRCSMHWRSPLTFYL